MSDLTIGAGEQPARTAGHAPGLPLVVDAQVPPAIVNFINAKVASMRAWREEDAVLVTQEMVDIFVALTGDPNPLHRADYDPHPIVPGLLLTALLPSLAPGATRELLFPGYEVKVQSVTCGFFAEVPVGQKLYLRLIKAKPMLMRGTIAVEVDFRIGLGEVKNNAANGQIRLVFMPK